MKVTIKGKEYELPEIKATNANVAMVAKIATLEIKKAGWDEIVELHCSDFKRILHECLVEGFGEDVAKNALESINPLEMFTACLTICRGLVGHEEDGDEAKP